MSDETKPELRWQRATQWGCNSPQALITFMMMEMLMTMIIDENKDDDNCKKQLRGSAIRQKSCYMTMEQGSGIPQQIG